MERLIQKILGSFLDPAMRDRPNAIMARGAGGSLIAKVAGTGLAFGLTVLLTRLLSLQASTDYLLAIAWVNVLCLIGSMGFNTASLRFLAAYRSQSEWGLLRGFLKRSQQLALLASVGVALLLALIIALLRGQLRPELVLLFWAAGLLIPLKVLLMIVGSGLQGLKRVVLSQVPLTTLRPLMLGGILLVLVLAFKRELDATETMLLNVACTLLALLLAFALLRRLLPSEAKTAPAIHRTRDWLSVSFPMLIMTAFQLLLVRTDALMLGWLIDAKTAGIYLIAGTVATLVIFGEFAIWDIAQPLIAELHAGSRRRELQRLVTLAARASLAFAVPAAIFFFLFGEWALAIWKPEFTAGHQALNILIIGAIASAFVGPVTPLLTMTGRQRAATWVIGVSALVNIALNAIFIPRWGMVGAAWATTASSLFRSAAMSAVVWRLLKINPTAWSFTRSASASDK
jgi:O-antigen/teichoic acid export membrane protein